MDFGFKVPSTIPQDLLLIQDLIGTPPPPTITEKNFRNSLDSSDDSIASTNSEVESEDEVEADLAPHDENGGALIAASDSESHSVSDLETSSSSDSEEDLVHCASERKTRADDFEDEESGVPAPSNYLQTKNEIVDANVIIPTISEVEPCDALEKIGEIMNIVGNTVIVRGLPGDRVNSFSERALDAESLLVFEDRKVLGYIYETFGPTSQPLYQVKFNQHHPLDTDKVWLSREVFHIPQRSHFVFVDQLKRLRGSDASNIHDEEPADDEIEFSDDEKEAAFKAERKKKRGHSASFSRQSTPSRISTDNMVQDTYNGTNPYDAHGPYDDDYHFSQPSRPPPVPYDDPYADVPTSDVHVPPMELSGQIGEGSNAESCEVGGMASRGRIPRRGTRGRGDRSRPSWNSSRRNHHHTSQRTFDPDLRQSFPAASRTVTEYTRGYGHTADANATYPFVQPGLGAWYPPEGNSVRDYQQPFIQPHINPRFASVFGLSLPSAIMMPHSSQDSRNLDHMSQPQLWTQTVPDSAGSEGAEDSYRPL